ncbi:hypothetical protein ACP275_12G006000 [Erythranthe tilingii]
MSLFYKIKKLFFRIVHKSSMENKETSTMEENKETSTEVWSPFSDGIITNSPALENEYINYILYGKGIRRRRLPVFEEICPSDDATEKQTHPCGWVLVDEQIEPSQRRNRG